MMSTSAGVVAWMLSAVAFTCVDAYRVKRAQSKNANAPDVPGDHNLEVQNNTMTDALQDRSQPKESFAESNQLVLDAIQDNLEDDVEMETESVPAQVSLAIRTARGNIELAVGAAKEHEKTVQQRKDDAKCAADQKRRVEEEKEHAAKEASKRVAEHSEQAKIAAAAASTAINSQKSWKEANKAKEDAQDTSLRQNEEYNRKAESVRDQIRKLNEALQKRKEAKDVAAKTAIETAETAKDFQIKYEAATNDNAIAIEGLKKAQTALTLANEKMEHKTAEATFAGNEAAMAATVLEEAAAEWEQAKADLEQKENLRDFLWALFDEIEVFYDASSSLVRSMRKKQRKFPNCEEKPWECLISDGEQSAKKELKAVFENYNTIVVAFTKTNELHTTVYESIKSAEEELERNAMSQVKLACDPLMKLENEAKANDNWDDFNQKCGDGLWEALDIRKNRWLHLGNE